MARNKRMVKAKDSGMLSHLPATVIDNIMKMLPLEDAARTTTFSKIWSHRWRRLSQLVFDDSFCKQAILGNESALVTTIYQILLLHRGPLLKFVLSLSKLKNSNHIDQFIIFVSTKGIREFTLHIWDSERYKCPLSLCSCMELTHLELSFCVFEPPTEFYGFKKLLSLELRNVVIRADTLSRLISSSPLLDQLKLSLSDNCNVLEVSSPSLRYLLCEGHFCTKCVLYTPHLATCRMYFDNGRCKINSGTVYDWDPIAEASEGFSFSDCFPIVEFLELDYFYVKSIAQYGVPKRLGTTLSSLKIIKLHEICFEEVDEVLLVLCMLRSSPILEKIQIKAFVPETPFGFSHLAVEEMKESGDLCLERLREMEMQNVAGSLCEMEFIRVILSVSPILQKMVIGPNEDEVTDNGLEMLKTLTCFRRASPVAEVVYREAYDLPHFRHAF